jgi:hypothetical protein
MKNRSLKSVGVLSLMACCFHLAFGQSTSFSVNATRDNDPLEANGHTFVNEDWFVALPSRNHLAKLGSWDTPADSLGGVSPVRVRVTVNARSVIAPVWDVGPQNTLDDYWNANRDETFVDLCSLHLPLPPQGIPELQWAFQQDWHFGYTVSKPLGNTIRR